MINEETLAPDLLKLCHRNGCTCEYVDTWNYGPDEDEDDDWPSDWMHDDDCPLALEIELVLAANNINPDDHAVAFAVLNALQAETIEAVTHLKLMWLSHPPNKSTPFALALLDWREYQLTARSP